MAANATHANKIAAALDRVRARGVNVSEEAGARTRGHKNLTRVNAIICHHTAGGASGNYPSLRVVRDGRAGLSGPLSQFGIGRDGTVYWIASGVAYHAGVADAGFTNEVSLGIEAENTGVGEPWGDAIMNSYRILCHELAVEFGVPNGNIRGHKEIAVPRGRKSDPTFDMGAFRAQVAAVGGAPAPAPAPASGDTYTVQRGDTLSGIGAKVGVAWKTIASLNGIGAPYTIKAGQVLRIRGGAPAPAPASAPAPTKPQPPFGYAFPLPTGHWFGVASSNAKNHSGYWVADRAHVVELLNMFRRRGWGGVPNTDRYTAEVAALVGRYQVDAGLRKDDAAGINTWNSLRNSPVR